MMVNQRRRYVAVCCELAVSELSCRCVCVLRTIVLKRDKCEQNCQKVRMARPGPWGPAHPGLSAKQNFRPGPGRDNPACADFCSRARPGQDGPGRIWTFVPLCREWARGWNKNQNKQMFPSTLFLCFAPRRFWIDYQRKTQTTNNVIFGCFKGLKTVRWTNIRKSEEKKNAKKRTRLEEKQTNV